MTHGRPVNVTNEEIGLVLQDLKQARAHIEQLRYRLAQEKERHLQLWTTLCGVVAVMVPIYNEWPWYGDLAAFVGIFWVGIKLAKTMTGVSDKDTEIPDEIVYERNSWEDWFPRYFS